MTGVPINYTSGASTYTAQGLDIVEKPDIEGVTVKVEGNSTIIGQLAVHLDRGDDAGHLIQLARRAAQRDLGGHGGGLVQHIAAGDRHRGGVYRDGNGLFADLDKAERLEHPRHQRAQQL